MKTIKLETPEHPQPAGYRVHLVEPRQVWVAIEGAGRELMAGYIEDDTLAHAHILAGDIAIYDKERQPREGDVVLVFDAGKDDWLPRLFDPDEMDVEARNELWRAPREQGVVYATLVGLVRVPDFEPEQDA